MYRFWIINLYIIPLKEIFVVFILAIFRPTCTFNVYKIRSFQEANHHVGTSYHVDNQNNSVNIVQLQLVPGTGRVTLSRLSSLLSSLIQT